jgi:tRNA pseudouridine-54 N-methylase
VRFEILAMIGTQLRHALGEREDAAVDAVLAGRTTPSEVVRRMLAEVPVQQRTLRGSE